MPTVEIIATGSEMLAGRGLNTDAAYLSQHLVSRGFSVVRHQTLGDDLAQMVATLRRALAEVDLVITTGGLGPTLDDLTRDAISEATGIPLVESKEVVQRLRQRFQSLGRVMPEQNLVQARVPARGGWLPNPHGTAPGLYFDLGERWVLALPGPPRELCPMWENHALPLLIKRFSPTQKRLSKTLQLVGAGESNIDAICRPIVERAPEITYGILAKLGLVSVTLSRWVDSSVESDSQLDAVFRNLQNALGTLVYSTTEDKPLEEVIGEMLRERKETLVTAESCTGGLIAQSITSVAGSSDYFLGSFVTYSNALKVNLLGVDEAVIREHGAVSREVARLLAEGARQRSGADLSISVTGIAGPGGGSAEKPVGLVYIAVANEEWTVVEEFRFFGSRDAIRERARVAALNQLRLLLLGQL